MVTNDMLVTMRGKKDISIPAGQFKAKCLALFDEVEARRRSYVVTKRGRPVARIVPIPPTAKDGLLGSLVHEEDLLAPIDVKWDDGS
jgi:prevent-host-death family protein